jgi:hypothetical protein
MVARQKQSAEEKKEQRQEKKSWEQMIAKGKQKGALIKQMETVAAHVPASQLPPFEEYVNDLEYE